MQVDVGQDHERHDDAAGHRRHDGLHQAAVDGRGEDVVPDLPRASEGDEDERPEDQESEPVVDEEAEEQGPRPKDVLLEDPLQVLDNDQLEAVVLWITFFHFTNDL